MSVVAKFRKSEEYKKYSSGKKNLFERHVREVASSKDARSVSESSLNEEDVNSIRGKINEYK